MPPLGVTVTVGGVWIPERASLATTLMFDRALHRAYTRAYQLLEYPCIALVIAIPGGVPSI